MVVLSFVAKTRAVASALIATVALIGAHPAFANSSASTDISAPLRAAQASKQSALGKGDEEFHQLFNSWQSLEQPETTGLVSVSKPADGGGTAASFAHAVASVSIPSLMPVDTVRLTSGFGLREHPVLGGIRQHKGVDLGAPTGTPIYATANGVVEMAQWYSGYGLYVAIEHGGNIETRYGHMSQISVAAGQYVKRGEVIGYVGATGRATGPHLHYEVRVNGEAVNPLPYMQGGNLVLAADTASPRDGKGGPG